MFDSKQSRKGISASTVIVVLNLVQLWDASEAVGVADRHSREKHRQHTCTHQYFLSSNQTFLLALAKDRGPFVAGDFSVSLTKNLYNSGSLINSS